MDAQEAESLTSDVATLSLLPGKRRLSQSTVEVQEVDRYARGPCTYQPASAAQQSVCVRLSLRRYAMQ